jgi:hypothetical protein
MFRLNQSISPEISNINDRTDVVEEFDHHRPVILTFSEAREIILLYRTLQFLIPHSEY